jgi:ferritin-like metal-binding protein YciE
LQDAIKEHLEETRHHVERLEEAFEQLEEKPRAHKCKAMEGLLEEGKEIMQADAEDSVRDAALIAACQRVEHYEIAGYGCARTFAQRLELDSVVQLLEATLEEEKNADQKLSEIAEQSINEEAEVASE